MADGPLVLVVDDMPLAGQVMAMLLQQIGCRTIAVVSAGEAIAMVAQHPVELVLMDCMMPGMDGWQATAEIRRLHPARRLPIIAMSGCDDPGDLARSRAAGMDDHLPKPVQLASLRRILQRWCGSGTAEPAAAPAPPPAAPCLLDAATLERFERMRPGSADQLLAVFARDVAAAETTLQRAIADGDLPAAARLAHRLKGSALTIGAIALGEAMRSLDRACRDGSLSRARDDWRQAETTIAATRRAIAGRQAPVLCNARTDPQRLIEQRHLVASAPGLTACLEAMPLPAVLLNRDQQIVLTNRRFTDLLGVADPATVLGRRTCEALGCPNATSLPEGCGAAPACGFCGAVQAVHGAISAQRQEVREALLRIGTETGHLLELEVTATPLPLAGQGFVLLVLRDIADLKRRQALEHLFFHDVRNSLGIIDGLANQLASGSDGIERTAALRTLAGAARQALAEVEAQQALVRAEHGELHVELRREDPAELLREVRDACAVHPVAAARSLTLACGEAAAVRTDRMLFVRVMVNLVRNAIEATPAGGVVAMGCRLEGTDVVCWVRNPGELSVEVRSQLFQRSFSTKGQGRGLGTWSARLFGERHLGGRVAFTSSVNGTEFTFALPRVP